MNLILFISILCLLSCATLTFRLKLKGIQKLRKRGSWQVYVDENMVGTGMIIQGMILGNSDGSVWAASAGFTLKPGEAQKIISFFNDPTIPRANGIFVQGEKYMCLKADSRSVYGKKGRGGVILVKTIQAVLIGIYNEKSQPGQATNVIEKLADYLIDNGY